MSSGRTWSLLAVGIAVVGVVGAATWLSRAQAETTQVEALKAVCERPGMHHRRAAALRDLAEIDSDASRAALESLADSKDEQLAVLAIAALGRAAYSGARTKLADVVADDKRSEFARSMAVTAALRAEHKIGASKSSVTNKFASDRSKCAALDDAAKATQDRLWGKE